MKRTINASEIGDYLFCAKAWHLKRLGAKAQGPQLQEGVKFHERHEAGVAHAARLRTAGIILALFALLLLILIAIRGER